MAISKQTKGRHAKNISKSSANVPQTSRNPTTSRNQAPRNSRYQDKGSEVVVDESLRLALVDLTYDDEKISDSRRYEIEAILIDRLIAAEDNSGLFWNGSYHQGYRVYDCADERSFQFIRSVVESHGMEKMALVKWKFSLFGAKVWILSKEIATENVFFHRNLSFWCH